MHQQQQSTLAEFWYHENILCLASGSAGMIVVERVKWQGGAGARRKTLGAWRKIRILVTLQMSERNPWGLLPIVHSHELLDTTVVVVYALHYVCIYIPGMYLASIILICFLPLGLVSEQTCE